MIQGSEHQGVMPSPQWLRASGAGNKLLPVVLFSPFRSRDVSRGVSLCRSTHTRKLCVCGRVGDS